MILQVMVEKIYGMKVALVAACMLIFSCNCNSQRHTDMTTTEHQYTNHLINETSPYLLQHAHNPVDWYPWGDEALQKAKAENKPMLISIGYSACHWCHVMERESFEDTAIARIMNENFICIKVDREERPDIDQVYMNAVQLMTGRGGWPLNCFALPDGRPVYGGTYFPKDQWLVILNSVSNIIKNEPQKAEDYATQLTQGVRQSDLIPMNSEKAEFTKTNLENIYTPWTKHFDHKEGGPNRAPKFPLPNNYDFLLRYAYLSGNSELKDYINLTLEKMAFGGIYDQVGGGFARYSVDDMWKAPHFEKMLYDNGQLVSLYSEAYRATKKELYKEIVYQTLEFIEREMTSPEGAFYSALDADSEGEEGKFYVWKKEELQSILGADFEVIQDYYNINSRGLWEHGNYILLRRQGDEDFAKKHNMSMEALKELVLNANAKLMEARSKRIRPGLDDKQLTSWNALMAKGYVDAYRAFGETHFLEVAKKNLNFILHTQRRDDGGLWHSHKNGRSTINGFLEDYCFTIEALIAMYEATFEVRWLNEAKALANYSLDKFYDDKSGMFFFNSEDDEQLITRKTEVNDNVIPASNSSMAKGLFYLGHYFDNQHYLDVSKQMLNNVKPQMAGYGSGYSNWAILMLHHAYPFYEIAIAGNAALTKRAELEKEYIPNYLLIGTAKDENLPLLEHKYVEGSTKIYVCVNKACQMPVTEVREALVQVE